MVMLIQQPKSYLGMLYKGKGTADLDSCIYYASAVIDNGYYELESDFYASCSVVL